MAKLTELLVNTYHPEDYVLINEADGSVWRGRADGTWKREVLVELAKIHTIIADVNKRLEEKYGTT